MRISAIPSSYAQIEMLTSFNLNANELPNAANSRVTFFADDTTDFERIPNFNLSTPFQTVSDIDTWIEKTQM